MDSQEDLERKRFEDGIKERLEEICEYDMFYKYGILIAKNMAKFDSEWIKNPAVLLRNVPEISKMHSEEDMLDW